ncbi:MAG: M48 family metallopeptidase [Opitutaceae bacterium]
MHFELSDNQQIPIEIRRRKGTRHLKLSIGYQNQVVLSVPWRCSEKEALKFAEKQRAWITKQLATAPATRTLTDWLAEHPRISGSGDVFHVRVEAVSNRVRPDYIFDAGGADLVLRIPDRVEDKQATLLQLVRRFAKDALGCRVPYHAKRLGLEYTKLSVRDQSSRWGSCSSSRGISLNWRLVLLAPELQDYVILHELAHLTEMNHSNHFWALLDSYDPERVSHENRLDTMTAEIMRVGRS